MAIKEGNERIYVTMSREMAEKVRQHANRIGLTVSGFMAMAAAEKVTQYEMSIEMVEKHIDELLKVAIEEMQKNEK